MRKLIFIFLFGLIGCTKFDDPIIGLGNKIELVTSKVSVLSSDSAIFEGKIIKVGNEGITERGFAYNTNPKPQVNTKSIKSGTGLGDFTGIASDLLPNTNYFISAYAYNKFGTIYGNELSFFTPKSPPRLKATTISTFTPYSAVIISDILLDGGNEITERGVCWNTKPKPVITDNKSINYSTSNSFETSILNLTPSSTYYVRSYALNSLGVGYGQEIILRTLDIKPAILENNCIGPSLIGYDEAKLNINVIDNGLSLNLETGIIIGLTPNSSELTYKNSNTQTIKSSLITSGKATVLINNLSVNTKYYYVAFAKNESGISYTPICTFKTLDYTPPELNQTCITASNIGTNLATITADVNNDGGIKTIEKGFIFSTSNQYLTYQNQNSQTVISSETVKGKYSFVLTKLKAKTKYYYIAYAKNSKGVSYGSQCNFTTSDYGTPQTNVNCVNPSDITKTSVKIYGNVIDDGGDSELEKGFVYGQSSDLKYTKGGANTLVSSGKGKGEFSFVITNLNRYTNYYYKSFAITETGNLAYGPLCDFTTKYYDLPMVGMDCLNNSVEFTSANIQGNVINWGGADFYYSTIEKGILFSTNSTELTGSNPIGIKVVSGNSGTGNFTTQINNLQPGTNYYYRIYATNASGTSYSGICSFQTKNYTLPTFEQNCVSDSYYLTFNSNRIYSSNYNDGGIKTDFGFLVSTSSSDLNVSNSNIKKINTNIGIGTNNGTYMAASINNLNASTTYFYRSYITNPAGTGYGPICSFTTNVGQLPIVITDSPSTLTSLSANLNGYISSDGGSPIVEKGFEWSIYSNLVSKTVVSVPGNSSTFTYTLIKNNTAINRCYRTYAKNGIGTSYGSIVCFPFPPQ